MRSFFPERRRKPRPNPLTKRPGLRLFTYTLRVLRCAGENAPCVFTSAARAGQCYVNATVEIMYTELLSLAQRSSAQRMCEQPFRQLLGNGRTDPA